MRPLLLAALSFFALFTLGTASYAHADQSSFRYNRISFDYRIQPDGTVETKELLTILYNGSYHSSSRGFADATSTSISDISVSDGATGEPFIRSDKALPPNDPSSWGKYTVFSKDNVTHVEWYYNTNDQVHTWVVSYTLHGVLTEGNTRFSRTLFSGYDVPVDAVEAEVHLWNAVTSPQSSLYTTGGHDYYIDRPDDRTFRFRVSDIQQGEEVDVSAGWQKGMGTAAGSSIALGGTGRLGISALALYTLAGLLYSLTLATGFFFLGRRKRERA